jgi:hypothetical protein
VLSGAQQLVAVMDEDPRFVLQCGLLPARLPALVEANPPVAAEALRCMPAALLPECGRCDPDGVAEEVADGARQVPGPAGGDAEERARDGGREPHDDGA